MKTPVHPFSEPHLWARYHNWSLRVLVTELPPVATLVFHALPKPCIPPIPLLSSCQTGNNGLGTLMQKASYASLTVYPMMSPSTPPNEGYPACLFSCDPPWDLNSPNGARIVEEGVSGGWKFSNWLGASLGAIFAWFGMCHFNPDAIPSLVPFRWSLVC